MVMKLINIVMRALQFFFALLILAMTGNMIAESISGNPSIVNFATACAVIAMLCLFYLIPATIKDGLAFHPIILISVDVLNTLLWFCAAVALAAELGVHSCTDRGYTNTNSVTNGTYKSGQEKRCREAQASCAFLWFGFGAFAITSVTSGLQSRGGANVRPGGGNPFGTRNG